nr:hypothetical protein CFP56_47628 [Quercus suber]
MRGAQSARDKQFGSWLRASTPHPSKKSVIRVVGYEEDSVDNGVTGTESNVTDLGSDVNKGSVMMGGAREEEQRSNHGSNPERRVDQEVLFQESPYSEQIIMAGAEIKDVNASREVNRRINSNDSNADFQAQLKEIDKELNKFNSMEGIVEVGPVSMQGLGVDGLGLTGQQVAFEGLLLPKMIRRGARGVKAQDGPKE